jgi:hypothetical protein
MVGRCHRLTLCRSFLLNVIPASWRSHASSWPCCDAPQLVLHTGLNTQSAPFVGLHIVFWTALGLACSRETMVMTERSVCLIPAVRDAYSASPLSDAALSDVAALLGRQGHSTVHSVCRQRAMNRYLAQPRKPHTVFRRSKPSWNGRQNRDHHES